MADASDNIKALTPTTPQKPLPMPTPLPKDVLKRFPSLEAWHQAEVERTRKINIAVFGVPGA